MDVVIFITMIRPPNLVNLVLIKIAIIVLQQQLLQLIQVRPFIINLNFF